MLNTTTAVSMKAGENVWSGERNWREGSETGVHCVLGCPKKLKILVSESTTLHGLCMHTLSHQNKFQDFWMKIEPLRSILSFRIFAGAPYMGPKKVSVYRVHYTQNDRLELTVSTQKSVLKNMHQIPR